MAEPSNTGGTYSLLRDRTEPTAIEALEGAPGDSEALADAAERLHDRRHEPDADRDWRRTNPWLRHS